jgi:hypothetical protein
MVLLSAGRLPTQRLRISSRSGLITAPGEHVPPDGSAVVSARVLVPDIGGVVALVTILVPPAARDVPALGCLVTGCRDGGIAIDLAPCCHARPPRAQRPLMLPGRSVAPMTPGSSGSRRPEVSVSQVRHLPGDAAARRTAAIEAGPGTWRVAQWAHL